MAWREDSQKQAQLKTSIEHVLDLIYMQHFEVPFIAMYRKEVSQELLLQVLHVAA